MLIFHAIEFDSFNLTPDTFDTFLTPRSDDCNHELIWIAYSQWYVIFKINFIFYCQGTQNFKVFYEDIFKVFLTAKFFGFVNHQLKWSSFHTNTSHTFITKKSWVLLVVGADTEVKSLFILIEIIQFDMHHHLTSLWSIFGLHWHPKVCQPIQLKVNDALNIISPNCTNDAAKANGHPAFKRQTVDCGVDLIYSKLESQIVVQYCK